MIIHKDEPSWNPPRTDKGEPSPWYRQFAWWPIKIGSETVWLETYEWRYWHEALSTGQIVHGYEFGRRLGDTSNGYHLNPPGWGGTPCD